MASAPHDPSEGQPAAGPSGPGEAGHPYRARVARVARRLAPPLSGRLLASGLGASMLLAALLLPLILRKPGWIEAELVLLAWWGFGVVVLTGLLYTGRPVTLDGRLPWEPSGGGSLVRELPGFALMFALALFLGPVGEMLVLVIDVVVWLVLPTLVLLVYYLVVKALVRVANDSHACQGRFPRSLVWAACWATFYMTPLFALVAHVALAG